MPYIGGCACGAIRFEARSEPMFQNHCQCRHCQQRSGTGHGSYVTFAGRADLLMLLARTDPDRGAAHRGLSLFVVEKDPTPGHAFVLEQPDGGKREVEAAGSGVIVDAKQGYILTNHHVVDNADKITVTLADNRSLSSVGALTSSVVRKTRSLLPWFSGLYVSNSTTLP